MDKFEEVEVLVRRNLDIINKSLRDPKKARARSSENRKS